MKESKKDILIGVVAMIVFWAIVYTAIYSNL